MNSSENEPVSTLSLHGLVQDIQREIRGMLADWERVGCGEFTIEVDADSLTRAMELSDELAARLKAITLAVSNLNEMV